MSPQEQHVVVRLMTAADRDFVLRLVWGWGGDCVVTPLGCTLLPAAGSVIARLYAGAIKKSRRIKPTIPPVGEFGIPIRDEVELEIRLERPAPG